MRRENLVGEEEQLDLFHTETFVFQSFAINHPEAKVKQNSPSVNHAA